MTTVSVETILKHPFISRRYKNGVPLALLADGNAALRIIFALRRHRRDAKAGRRNYREEAGAAMAAEYWGGTGAAYEAGYMTVAPRVPNGRAEIARALAAPGNEVLPEDLRALMAAFASV